MGRFIYGESAVSHANVLGAMGVREEGGSINSKGKKRGEGISDQIEVLDKLGMM